jgi:hypothetical protein
MPVEAALFGSLPFARFSAMSSELALPPRTPKPEPFRSIVQDFGTWVHIACFGADKMRPAMTIPSLFIRAGIFPAVHIGVLAGIVMLF